MIYDLWFMVRGSKLRVRVKSSGFRVWGLEFQSLGFMMQGLWLGVYCSGCRVYG
jgi:hypothetical protein